MGGHEYQDRMKNVGLYTQATTVFLYFCILNPPPPQNVWHKYQDGMKNVGLFTYPRNSSLSLPHALLNCARTTAVCLYFCICNTTQDNAEQYKMKLKTRMA